MFKIIPVLILLFCSGNPWLTNLENYDIILIVLTIITGTLESLRFKNTSHYLFSLFVVILVFMVHTLTLNHYSITPYFGLLLKIWLGVSTVRLVGSSFPYIYVRVMVFFALLSLVFFSLTFVNVIFEGIAVRSDLNSLIVYNYKFNGHRNSGFFWEPGAHAAFLSLALIMSAQHKMTPFYIIVFVITIITTQSTTGAVFLIIFVISKLFDGNMDYLLRGILVMLLTGCSLVVYKNIPFLDAKISSQLALVDLQSRDYSSSRFSTAIFDWHYIRKHPISGNGLSLRTRYSDHQQLLDSKELGHGMGFSHFLATFGIMGVGIFFYSIKKFFVRRHRIYMMLFSLFLMSEQLLNYPIWLVFSLILYYENRHYINRTQSLAIN